MTDILRYRGDTHANEFIIKSKSTGLPIDITGYTFILTVDLNKAPADVSNNLFQLNGQIINGPQGRVGFSPTAGQSDLVGSFFYDIQMADLSGIKRTLLTAKYKFVQDITK